MSKETTTATVAKTKKPVTKKPAAKKPAAKKPVKKAVKAKKPAATAEANLRKQPILVPHKLSDLVEMLGADATVLVGRTSLTEQVTAIARDAALAKLKG